LIGLKGLGSETSLDSLGALVFDIDCDITDPNGPGLAAKGIAPLPEEILIVQEPVTPPVEDEEST